MANTQVTTGKVRFSYVNAFTPRARRAGHAPKYSVTLLISKSDKYTLDKINLAIAAAKAAYVAKNPGKAAPKQITLHDGDGERPLGGDFGPECKGCYVITVSSKNPPVCVDAFKNTITDPQELYSGCYGRAVINFYAYETSGNRGITAGLNGLMKLTDGEPLAGGIITDSDWDDDWTDDDDLLG